MAGRLTYGTLWSLFRTLDFELRTESVDPYDSDGCERFLFSLWHDSAVMAVFGGRHNETVALTSRHRDGTFVASVLERVGVKPVRGSSGGGGKRAALELMRYAKDNDIVITPDGPRGPRRRISRGIVYLASKTQNAIVPTAFACSNAWEIPGSWTSLTVPKPFSRVVLLVGKPIAVPAGISDDEMAWYVNTLQREMDRLHQGAVAEVCNRVVAPMASIRPIVTDKAA